MWKDVADNAVTWISTTIMVCAVAYFVGGGIVSCCDAQKVKSENVSLKLTLDYVRRERDSTQKVCDSLREARIEYVTEKEIVRLTENEQLEEIYERLNEIHEAQWEE